MNVATIGLPERSWASAGAAAQYARGLANYKKALWRMTFLEIALAFGTTTGVGAVAALPVYRFPRPVHVKRMFVFALDTATGLLSPAAMAALEFGISDVSDRPRDQASSGQFVTDGRFNTTVPTLAMSGTQFGWFLIDRFQPHNSQWIWTLTNTSGALNVLPIVLLDVAPATEGQVPAVAP